MEGIRTQNEVMTIKVRDLETKLTKQADKALQEQVELLEKVDSLEQQLEEKTMELAEAGSHARDEASKS